MKSLITGASSGIGAAFARRLGAAGSELVLVAKRADRLSSLADELRTAGTGSVEIFPADLSQAAELERLERYVRDLDALDLLINNAGFGTMGAFGAVQVSVHRDMVRVHDLAAMSLCHAALPGMAARKHGRIVNVASIAAFLPVPGNAVYSASKVFLVAFSQALHAEMAGQGIRVQALCPGFTYSGFHDTPEMVGFHRSSVPGFMWMAADEVAARSLAAVDRGPVVVIPGFRNQLLVSATRNRFVFGLARLVRGRWK